MKEIVNIGVSHRVCHVLAHYYNGLENLLVSGFKECSSNPQLGTFLHASVDSISHTVSYEPRSILLEARGGSGSSGRFQYWNSEDYYMPNQEGQKQASEQHNKGASVQENSKLELITWPRVPQSEFQIALDNGLKLPELNPLNTKYWSDYGRMVYRPRSLLELREWHHDPTRPNLPDLYGLKQQGFETYESGLESWSRDFECGLFEEGLHDELERCDTLQGLNVMTDIDSGWGGVSASLVSALRDELPKVNIYGWGIGESDARLRSRVRTTLAMVEFCDMYVPINTGGINLSLWEQAGRICQLFDTLNALVADRSMATVSDELTGAVWQRNIVSRSTSQKEDFSQFSTASAHVFNNMRIERGTTVHEWNPPYTMPSAYKSLDYIDMAVTSTIKDLMRDWRRTCFHILRCDNDREDVLEKLENIAFEYSTGDLSDNEEYD